MRVGAGLLVVGFLHAAKRRTANLSARSMRFLLFGGRGAAFAAVLGVLVIQSISSGLTLLSLDSSYRFFFTGVVPLLAVGVDSLARRSRTTHGRA